MSYHKNERKALCTTESVPRIVLKVAEGLGYKHVYYESDKPCVMWLDKNISNDQFYKLCDNNHNINRIPDLQSIAGKDKFAKSLNFMKKLFPDSYDFFPKTFSLNEHRKQKKRFSNIIRRPHSKAEKRSPRPQTVHSSPSPKNRKTYIVKPYSGSRGDGITLTQNLSEIETSSKFIRNEFIVQEYITNPMLIQKFKFDFRLYVLISSIDPFEFWVHEQGLARFATETYRKPSRFNLNQEYMHLTNHSLNKFNKNFDGGINGAKRNINTVFDVLSKNGEDVPELWEKIKSCIIKTMLSLKPSITYNYNRFKCKAPEMKIDCFQILGIDILLDSKGKPWVLEINHNPSFQCEVDLDVEVKYQVIHDAMIIVGLSNRAKNSIDQMGGFEKLSNDNTLTEIPETEKGSFWSVLQETFSMYSGEQGRGMSSAKFTKLMRSTNIILHEDISMADIDLIFIDVSRGNKLPMMYFEDFVEAILRISRKIYSNLDSFGSMKKVIEDYIINTVGMYKNSKGSKKMENTSSRF
eukprot:gb/GECH01002040.1/.p1 GENE.gb/GECH01002040.1/~~gb/GECH01002040.1/.p1  ORF type:complete len:522 (+),score=101.09 gb/GECH01002040.1/:1-1566(+)